MRFKKKTEMEIAVSILILASVLAAITIKVLMLARDASTPLNAQQQNQSAPR
jgi:hypothetical protein